MNNNEYWMAVYKAQKTHREVVTKAIEICGHRKRIDCKLIEALCDLGLRCYMTNDKKLITTEVIDGEHETIINAYLPRNYRTPDHDKKLGCWDQLAEDLAEIDWDARIRKLEKDMACYDDERAKLVWLKEQIEGMEFRNYNVMELRRIVARMILDKDIK